MKYLASLIIALSTSAHADEWRYGLHLISLHKPGTHMQTVTPGAYMVNDAGLTIGSYRNSQAKFSAYIGKTFKYGQWQLTTGLVTGYARKDVLPMVVPGYRFSNGYRISIVPNPFGQSAIHLSMDLQ